jgi:DNA-binding NarL/FixJ family response regulator
MKHEENQIEARALEPRLSRRLLQTLCLLLDGLSEKEIAAALQLSPHTVHDYVKSLYRTYRVRSRAELHARFGTSALAQRLRALQENEVTREVA